MLAKLCKFEWTAAKRTLLPLYFTTLLVSVICGVDFFFTFRKFNTAEDISMVGTSSLPAILFLVFFALVIAVNVMTLLVIIQRFYQDLLERESYLMFTLPVSAEELLGSKVIMAMLWQLLTGIVIIISLGIMCLGCLTSFDWSLLQYAIQEHAGEMVVFWSGLPWTEGIVGMIGWVLDAATTVVIAYVAMLVGQMEPFRKHRMIVSIIAFFVLEMIISFGENLLLFPIHSVSSFAIVSIYGFVVSAIIFAACFYAGTWLMKHKLSL